MAPALPSDGPLGSQRSQDSTGLRGALPRRELRFSSHHRIIPAETVDLSIMSTMSTFSLLIQRTTTITQHHFLTTFHLDVSDSNL